MNFVKSKKQYITYDLGEYTVDVMVRLYRNMACLSQEQLAKRCGLSRNTISSIETGQYCVSAIHRLLIARALHCEFEDMFRLRKKVKHV